MSDMTRRDKPVEINLPADYRRRRATLGVKASVLLSALTMLMLTAIQEPVGWSVFGWVALVPWVLAAVTAKRPGRMAIVSYVTGLIYYLGNLYWLAPVTAAGYGALCLYLGGHFVLSGFVLRQVYLRRRWPFTIVLPIAWVGQEYLRAILLTGFPWLFLAHSQHESIRLIQISDLVGAYGVTFLIAMTNGLICDLLLRPLKHGQNRMAARLGPAALILLTACCLVGSVLYGHWRIEQGRNTITPGPVIAVVQESIPQYVKESSHSSEDIFSRHIKLSEQAIAAEPKPALIVWPETMTCSPLNSEFLDLKRLARRYDLSVFQPFVQSQAFDSQLRQLAKGHAAILVGTPAVEMRQNDARTQLAQFRRWNSAILYLPDGTRHPARYDKMHLVPFGEVVPFKESWPWLHRVLNSLTPYDYDYTLDAGTDPVVFEFTAADGSSSRFAVAICYEDVMPQVPRRLTAVEQNRKRVDFLLNISNDGWFVRGRQGSLTASSELIQHLVICKFRAVENRTGIVRAVNTGISAFIRPDGIVQQQPLAGTLSHKPQHRQLEKGFLTDRVCLDTRATVYSKIGDAFAIICTIVTVLLLLAGIPVPKRKHRAT